MEFDYERFVESRKKPGLEIQQNLTVNKVDLIHMAMGISGEAGELLDAIKKAAIYNKPLDVENVREELGDLEFYMEGLRQVLGLSRNEIILQNMRKLSKRYETGYSDAAAIERADKQ